MNSPLTVDVSVFVNAFSPTEEGSLQSWRFLTEQKANGVPVIAPVLLLTELAAAITRKQNNAELALRLALEVKNLPNLTLIDVDASLVELSSGIAARHRLRGVDAIYAAVAQRFTTPLVTLDREQLERLAGLVPVRKP